MQTSSRKKSKYMFIMESADQEQYYASSQFSGSATANKFEVFLDFIVYVLFFLQKWPCMIHVLAFMHHEEFNKYNWHWHLEPMLLTAVASLSRWPLVWYSGYFYLFLSFSDSRYHGDFGDHAGNVLFSLPGSL